MSPAVVSAPQSFYVEKANIGQNSLIGIVEPVYYRLECLKTDDCTTNDYIAHINRSYPQIANLLVCIWKNESTYGANLIGDNGNATGHFQVWLKWHPDIDKECANDFFCSLDWTAKKIRAGKSYLWTTTKLCQ